MFGVGGYIVRLLLGSARLVIALLICEQGKPCSKHGSNVQVLAGINWSVSLPPLTAVVYLSVFVEGGGHDLGHANLAYVLIVSGLGCRGSQVIVVFAIDGIVVLLWGSSLTLFSERKGYGSGRRSHLGDDARRKGWRKRKSQTINTSKRLLRPARGLVRDTLPKKKIQLEREKVTKVTEQPTPLTKNIRAAALESDP
jgi:hypothetical protein